MMLHRLYGVSDGPDAFFTALAWLVGALVVCSHFFDCVDAFGPEDALDEAHPSVGFVDASIFEELEDLTAAPHSSLEVVVCAV